MNTFAIGLVEAGSVVVGIMLAGILALKMLHRRRSRVASDQPEQTAPARTVRILRTQEELADAVQRAIDSEHRVGSRSTRRIRRYRRLTHPAGTAGAA